MAKYRQAVAAGIKGRQGAFHPVLEFFHPAAGSSRSILHPARSKHPVSAMVGHAPL